MGTKFKDLTGQTFGRLTVIKRLGSNIHNKATWRCFCSCPSGLALEVSTGDLKSGNTTSCGCFQVKRARESNMKHGHTRGNKPDKTYITWYNMKSRCLNQNHPSYKDYGGRGVTICDRWLYFENFLEDMGERPEGLTLDRRDNGKGYYKENCQWATYSIQANNKRNNRLIDTLVGIKTLAQCSKMTGLHCQTIIRRIKLGWSAQDTLVLKPGNRRYQHG